MGKHPLLREGEEPHFYDVERFSSCHIVKGDVNQLNDPLFRDIILRIVKPDNHSHSVVLLETETETNKAIVEDQWGIHHLHLTDLRDMWEKAGAMYAECPYNCGDYQANQIVARYARGSRAGHRGYVRRERSGRVTYHPQIGLSPELRERSSLKKKLQKRKSGRRDRGKRMRNIIQSEIGRAKGGVHRKVGGPMSALSSAASSPSMKAALYKAEHSLLRAFKGE